MLETGGGSKGIPSEQVFCKHRGNTTKANAKHAPVCTHPRGSAGEAGFQATSCLSLSLSHEDCPIANGGTDHGTNDSS